MDEKRAKNRTGLWRAALGITIFVAFAGFAWMDTLTDPKPTEPKLYDSVRLFVSLKEPILPLSTFCTKDTGEEYWTANFHEAEAIVVRNGTGGRTNHTKIPKSIILYTTKNAESYHINRLMDQCERKKVKGFYLRGDVVKPPKLLISPPEGYAKMTILVRDLYPIHYN